MAILNRTCVVCGEKYSYCYGCGELGKPSWMASFHDENCKNIYDACAGYNIGRYTKEETKQMLDKCNLANKANFTHATQKIIDEIYKEEKKILETKEIKYEPKTFVREPIKVNRSQYNKNKNKKR